MDIKASSKVCKNEGIEEIRKEFRRSGQKKNKVLKMEDYFLWMKKGGNWHRTACFMIARCIMSQGH
jgi:hypothetical protein